jgi:hypothetical protein
MPSPDAHVRAGLGRIRIGLCLHKLPRKQSFGRIEFGKARVDSCHKGLKADLAFTGAGDFRPLVKFESYRARR